MNPLTSQDVDVSPELASLALAEKPDGPGAAVLISAGLAIFVLGCLTILAEASDSANTWLASWQLGHGVGALAGKTTIASLVYFGSLALLWTIWRNRNVSLRGAFFVGMTLGILGAIGVFPTFFQMFAG